MASGWDKNKSDYGGPIARLPLFVAVIAVIALVSLLVW